MPAATLALEWESIKMLCVSLGVRPAIRQMGLEGTSTAETIRKRAQREGWLDGIARDQPVPITVSKPVPNVPKSPAEALAEAYREDRVETRMSVSRAARKAAKTLEDKSGHELIADGGVTLKTVAQTASLVHGWQEQSQARVVVCLQALEQSATVTLDPVQQGDAYDPEMDASNY